MATLADLLALQPATLPRYEGTLAEALLGGWSGKGQALPPEFSDWAPPMPGKRGMTDMLAAMLPLEQNSAGERRLGIPGAVQALPEMPKAIADMIRRGVTGDYQPTTEDPMTGRMYDPRQYEDAMNLAALVSTGGMPMPAPYGSLRAFSVWHGTPHKFPAERRIQLPDGTQTHIRASDPLPEGAKVLEELPLGRFRMDKINTGEGQQFYGHGLYTSESKNVASTYREGNQTYETLLNGRPVTPDMPEFSAVMSVSANGYEKALKQAEEWSAAGLVEQSEVNAIRALKGAKIETKPRGSMYKVQIDAEPQDFLAWDKPLSEQPEKIRQAVATFLPKGFDPSKITGAEVYRRAGLTKFLAADEQGKFVPAGDTLAEALAKAGGDPKRVRQIVDTSSQKQTEALRRAGLPGVRYVDVSSRANDKGSSNYVVFDDSLMKILLRE